jgi:hypothetical protein
MKPPTWKERFTRQVERMVSSPPEAQTVQLRMLARQIGDIMGGTPRSSFKTLRFMLQVLDRNVGSMRESSNCPQFEIILSMLGAQVQRQREDAEWRQRKDKMRRLGVLSALSCLSEGYTPEHDVLQALRIAGYSKRGAAYRLGELYRYGMLEDPHEDATGWRIGPAGTKMTKEGRRLYEELRRTGNQR